MIPDGWRETCLSDLGSTFGGLTGKSAQDFVGGNAQFVTFMNVMSNVVLRSDGVAEVWVGSNESQAQLSLGDVIFNGSSESPGELGFGSAVPIEFDGYYLNSFCFGFRSKVGAEFNAKYFAYLTRSSIGRAIIRPLAQGSTRYNLSKTNLLMARFPLPPLKEQEAIAEALSDADAALDALDALIAKKRDVKQAAMQQLLTGRTRLPGFSEPWLSHQIREITSIIRKTIDPRFLGDEEVEHYSLPAFDAGEAERITASSIGSLKLEVDQEVVLVSRLNPRIPRVWWVTPSDCRCLASTEFAPLAPIQGRTDGRFLMYLIQSDRVMGRLAELAIGTTGSHQRVQPAEVLNLIVAIPPFDEQKVIAEILGDIDVEIQALSAERQKMDLVKQGMMQELLTGRVRLV